MRRIRLAQVLYGRSGYELDVVEMRLRHLIVAELVNENLHRLTLGLGCCCRMYDWEWRIGWGERDEDGELRTSLGELHWRLGQWLMGYDARHEDRRLRHLPLDAAVVHETFPDSICDIEDENDDESDGNDDDVSSGGLVVGLG